MNPLNQQTATVAQGTGLNKSVALTFTPTAGSLLIAVIVSNATVTITGWTKVQEAIGNGLHLLMSRTATGAETEFAWTQNGDRVACLYIAEFPAGAVVAAPNGWGNINSPQQSGNINRTGGTAAFTRGTFYEAHGFAESTNAALPSYTYSVSGNVTEVADLFVQGPGGSYESSSLHVVNASFESTTNYTFTLTPQHAQAFDERRLTFHIDGSAVSNNWGTSVAVENSLTGDALPSISGYGSANVVGFARGFSANVGTTINFSLSVNTGSECDSIQIYRLGWYGGAGARLVDTIVNTPTLQPAGVAIPNSNGGYDYSNWSTTASWAIPAQALSGFFVAVPVEGRGDPLFWIPFIVRDETRANAKLIYKTSESTWANAYNSFLSHGSPTGGASYYGATDSMSGGIESRCHATTLNRPIVTRGNVPQTYWNYAEAPMIRFLERNGVDVQYISSKDLDQIPGILTGSQAFMSNGHDEYWSQAMWDAAVAFRNAGGKLIFTSGNEVFWRIRYDTTDPNIVWCYKDTMPGPGGHVAGAPLDPVTWTGTWCDTRWGARVPQNTLTGTFFRMNGVNYRAAVVQTTYATSPFWRNTTLSQGAITLTDAIGMEGDEAVPLQTGLNLAYLARTTVNIDGNRADDNGQTYNGNGNMDWAIVAQRYSSGGATFGFGTCTWSWLLDASHDLGPDRTNAQAQQSFMNLLADVTGAALPTPMAGRTAPVPVALSSYFIPTIDGTAFGYRRFVSGVGWVQLIAPGGQQGGPGGVSDHGALTGLSDDDHPQYARVDGSRAFTGQVGISNGGLILSGSATVPYTSPNNYIFTAQFALAPIALGNFQTLMTMAATSASNATGRLIGMFDARTGAHQATFGVFCPDESDIFGISWDGSNSEAYMKTLAAAAGFKIGNTITLLSFTRETQIRNILRISNISTYADDTAARAAGLTTNEVYKTSAGELRIVV